MISVIIPTYNRADRIKLSAESVLKQTYRDIELIIVDDGSDDNTEEVVRSLNDDRVIYIRQKNSGACAARNNGILHARGEYIAFQDSDDKWRRDKLEKQLECMKEYNADVCFCKMKRANYAANKAVYFPDIPRGTVEYSSLLAESLVSTQTILAKRAAFDEFKFDVRVKARQDWDWTIRAAGKYSFCFDDDVLVDVYLQNDSITANQNHEKIAKTLMQIYSKYKYLFKDYPVFQVNLLEQIAYQKTRISPAYAPEYRRKYRITRSKADLAKTILSKLRLLHLFYNIKLK
ncbi:MAG: glycosyltransferase family 2 protein [Ruminococcus sp.]|nr:glycosyltransferase family 2 protein [Ruminococcus sp.]